MTATRRVSSALALAAAVLMLASCGRGSDGRSQAAAPESATAAAADTSAQTAETQAADAGAAEPAAAAKQAETGEKGRPMAIITMEKGGVIEMELYPEDAPKTVENFIKLSKKGFYNGLTFHRVEPGFVVQGGDPNGNGTGGPGYTIKAEFNSRPHKRGTVAMARRADPDSAGSQFYICLAPAPQLDGQYTVFGQVVKGMDVVDQIRVGDKMKTVEIKE